MELTTEERDFIRSLVERELKEVEKHESDFTSLLNNSPILGQILSQDKDIQFLATQEKYHQFIKELTEKLK